ncbi:MAG: hypothetical protein ISS41_06985 [Candidatus Aminicenantes bacterium]|nr:hypothetical protein [Candidatus Aminicenantes bacterium]MBL7083357.1 hypothetical protein [Candidatus Aminicenantes bacterium]
MKKTLLITALVILSISVFSQEIFIKQSVVINIEVPVRVFKSGAFIDNLTINDFEVFEDGIPQKLEAVYLIKKRAIERSEEKKRFSPETSRNFFIFFEVAEYTAKLGEAVDYFVHNVILPGDNLYIITPMKTYRLKNKALGVTTREEIVMELRGLIRKDSLTGNSEYRATLAELTSLARSLTAGIQTDPETQTGFGEGAAPPKELDSFTSLQHVGMDLDELLWNYASLLKRLEILRSVEQMKLLEFAQFLKDKEGQKYVFLFYQREYIPQIEPRILNEYMNLHMKNQFVMQTLSQISTLSGRTVSIDVDRVKQAYADSSTSIHFLFITKPPPILPGIYFEEHSEDIYQPFKEMANATGGFVESSSNPAFLFQKALEASENYYLLYYSPKNYEYDGKFKKIKIKLKNKNYKVTHRAGYFAY